MDLFDRIFDDFSNLKSSNSGIFRDCKLTLESQTEILVLHSDFHLTFNYITCDFKVDFINQNDFSMDLTLKIIEEMYNFYYTD